MDLVTSMPRRDMTGPVRSDPELILLHALRCCDSASTGRLTDLASGMVEDDAEDILLTLAMRGLVTHDAGTFGGWRLTAAGRTEDADRISAELERAGVRSQVRDAFEDFVALNQRTLDICSDWQIRSLEPMTLNDHSDPAYDSRVLDRLAEVDAAAQPVCDRLAALLHRFSHYGPRLAGALGRAQDGDRQQVAHGLDSYHAVWFQLHEDLLVTLGIPRHA